ncbi:MAG: hypothetical protein HS104_09615 [Polyangiaceae bacterium]|nr:hypothetical protein [Polyangiaceae bacterium]MCE7890758.1 hypothetical protein [Sorangiineae bacterium PRO1]MCL4754344.1 hypothetical protein [Myxococcales bacterium]
MDKDQEIARLRDELERTQAQLLAARMALREAGAEQSARPGVSVKLPPNAPKGCRVTTESVLGFSARGERLYLAPGDVVLEVGAGDEAKLEEARAVLGGRRVEGLCADSFRELEAAAYLGGAA